MPEVRRLQCYSTAGAIESPNGAIVIAPVLAPIIALLLLERIAAAALDALNSGRLFSDRPSRCLLVLRFASATRHFAWPSLARHCSARNKPIYGSRVGRDPLCRWPLLPLLLFDLGCEDARGAGEEPRGSERG